MQVLIDIIIATISRRSSVLTDPQTLTRGHDINSKYFAKLKCHYKGTIKNGVIICVFVGLICAKYVWLENLLIKNWTRFIN